MAENSIQWLVDNHVIFSKAYNWNAQELADDILEVNKLVNQSELPLVHTLWDFTELATYPTSLNDIRKGIEPLFTNDRLGWVITVMHNPMVAFLSKAGSSMFGVRYNSVKTMDEAIRFLKERDTTLINLL